MVLSHGAATRWIFVLEPEVDVVRGRRASEPT
jgi:hypothetical protein